MENEPKVFFKIVPLKAYLAISMPIIFIFIFFSLFKFYRFDVTVFVIACVVLAVVLLIVNGVFYFYETRHPFLKIENEKIYYRFKNDWILLEKQLCKMNIDENLLEIKTSRKLLAGYMKKKIFRL